MPKIKTANKTIKSFEESFWATTTTYKLAKMSLAVRGLSANLGKVSADTFFKDQHPDLEADTVMANPPFNLKDWRGTDELVHDGPWNGYDTQPTGNANYAWILHMVSKLSEHGVAGFVLANGSMSTNTKGEGEIRRKLVENDLFDELIALRPDWAGTRREKKDQDIGYNPEDGAIRIVMTGTATDRKEIQDHVYTKQEKKRLEKRFKDPADPLKLVIVRDMWLTGFDAPCCHTMYVDKPMKGHNLAQSIARVNRVFKDKPGGLVVDYIGIAGDLKRAVKTYTDAKGKGQPTVKAEDALAILLEKMDVVRGMYHGFDYRAYQTDPLSILCDAANHILGLADGKKRYADVMASVSKAYSLCSTLDEAAAIRKEIAFFNAVKAIIVKDTTTPKKLSKQNKDSVLKQILDNAVLSEGVVDVFDLAGLDKPNISLLSDEFLEDVKNLKTQNLAVELLQRLLLDKIRANTRTNVVQEKKYSERLIETLRQYHNRAIETAQVIEELIKMAKDLQEAMQRDEELGLGPDEIAFYDALAERPEVLKQMGDETLKGLATELNEKLRASTSVDWQVRDSVRAKMRLLIKRLLRKYKYPPEGQEEAVKLVIKQAEALADSWTT